MALPTKRPARIAWLQRSPRLSPLRLAAIPAAAVLIAGVLPAAAASRSATAANTGDRRPSTNDVREDYGTYDVRSDSAAQKVLAARSAKLSAEPAAGVRALRKELGKQSIVEIDPLTTTPRLVARLDGLLTAAGHAKPQAVALTYVRSHADAFGLTAQDVGRLILRRDYVDITGTHHLSFIQAVGGIPVFGNGLQASVAADGTRATRSCSATVVTRRTSSITSTRTACPTGSSSTPSATRRSAPCKPARWVRLGATGTRTTSWSPRASSETPRQTVS